MDINSPEVRALLEAAIATALPAAVATALPGAIQQVNQQANQPPTVMAFARTPAQVNTGLINLESSEGMEIHNAATIALTTKFDGTTENIHMFLKNIKERGQSFRWDDILNIPDEDDRTHNLIDQYRLITLNSIRAHATTYKAAQARNIQNTTQMYMFLYASIHRIQPRCIFLYASITTPDENQTQYLE